MNRHLSLCVFTWELILYLFVFDNFFHPGGVSKCKSNYTVVYMYVNSIQNWLLLLGVYNQMVVTSKHRLSLS